MYSSPYEIRVPETCAKITHFRGKECNIILIDGVVDYLTPSGEHLIIRRGKPLSFFIPPFDAQ